MEATWMKARKLRPVFSYLIEGTNETALACTRKAARACGEAIICAGPSGTGFFLFITPGWDTITTVSRPAQQVRKTMRQGPACRPRTTTGPRPRSTSPANRRVADGWELAWAVSWRMRPASDVPS